MIKTNPLLASPVKNTNTLSRFAEGFALKVLCKPKMCTLPWNMYGICMEYVWNTLPVSTEYLPDAREGSSLHPYCFYARSPFYRWRLKWSHRGLVKRNNRLIKEINLYGLPSAPFSRANVRGGRLRRGKYGYVFDVPLLFSLSFCLDTKGRKSQGKTMRQPALSFSKMCAHKVAKALCDTSKKMKFTPPSPRPFCQAQRARWGAYGEGNTVTF